MPGTINYVGEFSLEILDLVVASQEKPINLKGTTFQGLVLYEDIYEPIITGSLLVSDSIALNSYGPITGQEELMLRLKTPTVNNPEKRIDFVDQPLIVTKVSNRQEISRNVEGYILEFTTRTIMKDRRTKVQKSLEGTYSDIVKELLTLSGANHRNNYIEPSDGIKKIVAPNDNPFNIILMIKKKAISRDSKSPTYLFFENLRGFHFRTLDSLYAQKSVHKLEPKQAGKLMDKGQHLITEELETILDHRLSTKSSILEMTDNGTFGSNLVVWNMFDKSYTKTQYNMLESQEDENNINHYQDGDIGDYSMYSETVDKDGVGLSELPAKSMLTSTSTRPDGADATFLTDNGTFNISTTDETQITQRRTSQMNRIGKGLDIEMHIYGNTLISVGDIVTCNIPTNITVEKKATEKIDKFYSGAFLVTHIRHDFSPGKKMKHEMQLKLTKDSIKEKINVKETTYPDTKMQCETHEEFYDW